MSGDRSPPLPQKPGSEYPERYETDVVLKNGSTLRLRPVRASDGPRLRDFHRRLSPESLHLRFFHVPEGDPDAEALARVDYEDSFALVGETSEGIVAVGRFDRDPRHRERAEAAFTILDGLQGQGIGTSLLERLAAIAREKGIETFEADVLPANSRMLDVFDHSGLEMTRKLEADVIRVALSIAPTAPFLEKSGSRHRQAAAASLEAFFRPRVVAVVGAGRRRGKIGSEILHNILEAGFRGRVVPVNPKAKSVAKRRSYPTIGAIPGQVDLAIVAVPARAVADVVDDAIEKGVKGVVVISAGFGETGGEGQRREAALLETIRGGRIRMIGPNCMGLVNTDPRVRLNATFAPIYPPAGRVGMLTQSGALGLAILDYARRLNLGISTFVSVGNKPDVSGNDLIQYWEQDPRTDVILLYLESFGNPRNFGRIAARVSRKKPIVAVKAGRSRAGSRAATSHTGALAESDTVVEALLRQSGVIRTRTLEELFDVAALLANQPLPAGRRVGILTNAGGPAILAADACEAQGLTLADLSPLTAATLRTFLPAAASVGNPVDMIASATPRDYERSIQAILADPGVDSLIVIYIPPIASDPDAVARAIVRGTRGTSLPVVATFLSAKGIPRALTGIPCYPFPESAAVALARVAAYGEWRRRPKGAALAPPGVREKEARAIVAQAMSRGGGWLSPEESGRLLDALGISAARARAVSDESEAVAAAEAIGYPVALKAVGPTILHKTEAKALALSLSSASDVAAAHEDLSRRLGAAMSGALVQEMVSGGVEVIVGATYDPAFGPLVLYGSGGTLVELLGDVSFRIAPLTGADIDDMLAEVRGTALLKGFRGTPSADIGALRDALARVSVLLTLCPEVLELDINPLKVLGSGAKAVDARIRVGRPPAPPRSRRVTY
jgi:acetyl coenzyme A synthetase (ADP forming)-like protein